MPVLTADTARVLGLVNLSLAVGIAANVLYVMYDARWSRSFGDLVTIGLGLAVLVRVWQVFPFDFPGSFNWPLLVPTVLVVAIVGSVLGILVDVIALGSRDRAPRFGRHGSAELYQAGRIAASLQPAGQTPPVTAHARR